jgi:hypothetical protein
VPSGLKPREAITAVSTPTIPEPARVVVSILTPHDGLIEEVSRLLEDRLGVVEEQIGPLLFPYTNYYDKEMGSGIRRWLCSFARLTDRSQLAGIKLLTNAVENAYTEGGKRRVNLDPGLMTLGNFVLATGKDNAHRIYLSSGIFADLTLVFRGGTYRPLEWTYPDYADPELIGILNRLREDYKWVLKQGARPTGP